MMKNKVGTNRRTLACSDAERDQLRSFARKYLDEQLAVMARDPDFHDRLGPNEVPEAVERVVDWILLEPVERPLNFDQSLVKSLEETAKKEALQLLNSQAATPGSQPVSAVQGAQLDSIVQGVKGKLLDYLLQLSPGPFVISDNAGTELDPSPGRAVYRNDREKWLSGITSEKRGQAGSGNPNDTGTAGAGEQVAGKTRQVRQTLVLAPLPFEPGFDVVQSDSHEVVPFATLRKHGHRRGQQYPGRRCRGDPRNTFLTGSGE